MDAPFHLMNANQYYNTVSDKDGDTEGETDSGEISLEYPPLLYWTTMGVYKLSGFNIKNAFSTTYIFTFIFLLASFLTGRLIGGKLCGILTLITAAFSHVTLELTHSYLLEMPQAAFVALALFFLLKTGRFKNQLYSILFGFTFALAMLAKQPSVFFILPAFLIYSVYSVYSKGKCGKSFTAVAIPVFLYTISGIGIILHAKSLGLSIETNNPVPVYGIPVIAVISAATFLFTYISPVRREKLFQGCASESVTSMMNVLRSLSIAALGTGIYYIWAVKGVIFKMSVHGGLASTASQKSGLPLFFVSLINYVFLLKHFGIILLLLAAFGLFMIFRNNHDKKWDVMLILAAGITGLAGHAFLAHAAVYYIHYLIIPLSVLAFINVKPAKPAGIIVIVLVAISAALNILYPLTNSFAFAGGLNPVLEKAFALSRNVVPDTTDYHLRDVMDSVEKARIPVADLMGDNPVPVLAWHSSGFRYSVTGPGEIDRQMYEVTREFMKLDDIFIYSFDSDWETPIKILTSYPVILITGIKDGEQDQTERMIRQISCRNLKQISSFNLSAGRIIYIYYLQPSGNSGSDEKDADYENTLRRMQRRPGEKDDMTGPAGEIIKKH